MASTSVPPPDETPSDQPPPGYQQPAGATPGDYPGKTLGIVGLVLSFFTAVIGLIVSIIALRKSKKAGFGNTPAVIGIIVGIVATVVAAVLTTLALVAAVTLANTCEDLGPGVHDVNGTSVMCPMER
ncbi:MAG: DUF4190 domain-containing protein [Microlunatus sp.]|nr:DUF4190 domain-containing protein [Microlunatus sp.]MDN5804821.1 DUF4190 domain-containing protein [Microlunatus sp.]